LIGFRSIVLGCGEDGGGVGFDDLLDQMGEADVAARLRSAIEDALSALDAVDEPTIEQGIAMDRPSVEALHASVKVVTDLYKSDVITLLDIDLSQENMGDND
jgi:hypothetical protein